MGQRRFSLNITNIGPHKNLTFSNEIKSLKILLYANNGSGKTFISRAFRLIEDGGGNTNNMLSFGENQGSFSFYIEDDTTKKSIKFNSEIKINNANTEHKNDFFIFHVFNSDYIKDNIESKGYCPNGNIEGYIVGKAQIDLSKEKQEYEAISTTLSEKKDLFEKEINKQKQKLLKLNISPQTTEFKNLNHNNIFMKKTFDYECPKTFQELCDDLSLLKSLPDNLSDISLLNHNQDDSFFEEMEKILQTSYSKSSFSDSFKDKIKKHHAFIQEGVKISKGEVCPFCEQKLNEQALRIIDMYNKFLTDSESQVIQQIDFFLQKILYFKEYNKNVTQIFFTILDSFNKTKIFFPSLEDKELVPYVDILNIDSAINNIINILEEKKINISQELNANLYIQEIKKWIEINKTIQIKNNKKIEEVNKIKNNFKKEKTKINKQLCSRVHLDTIEATSNIVQEIQDIEEDLNTLKIAINNKMEQGKIFKKDRFVSTLHNLLNIFFGNKYTFDEDNFCINFNNKKLLDNAQSVLSDGEKNLVALCFFLAETHLKIQKHDDYDRLFFILDDPISSLDFHHVYSISRLIKKFIHDIFKPKNLRILVLTHSLEFANILMRNKIVTESFILENQTIKRLQKEIILPYEEHLRDIYHVANEQNNPTHTTPNSIRHILETLQRFEKPSLELHEYCEYLGITDENAFLYALIQDNSHGGFQNQPTYTPEMIKNGCKKVIEIIERRYGGQIEVIKNSLDKQKT